MSDLSRMLDDLYALPDADTDVVADETPTRAPEWSSAEALDEAFASWVPGESEGSTAFERSLAEEPPATLAEALHVDVDVDVDDWLTATEPQAPEPVLAGPTRWSPSDDDILPSRRTRGRRR